MTTIQTSKPAATTANTKKSDDSKPELVTLDQLARELKMTPRDARMLLRLAAKQTKQYPNLGKEHVARQPWQWEPGSKALEEAKKALTTPVES